MNKEMLKKNVGAHVLLVPAACRLDQHGFEVKASVEDDWWLIESVTDEGVRISDPRTGHVRVLGYDHVYNFTSDQPQGGARRGFLTLKVQIFIQGNEVRILPNARPGEAVAPKRPEVIEKTVTISYPAETGLQARLVAEGYEIGWARPERVSTLVDIDGHEVVIEPDARGILAHFRTRDGLVLVKHRKRS